MSDRPASPWPRGSTTGLGSLPGVDFTESLKMVLDEVPSLPYVPELPARGLGADLIGRAGALLVDLPLEWQPHGWTIAAAGGRDARTARDHLSRDLDILTEQGEVRGGAAGLPLLKVQVCGPVTLAASVELPNLHKALTDLGAFRDLTASLAEGVALHLLDLEKRLPGTEFVLQVDEPSLPAALAGRIPTPSGYGTVRSLDPGRAELALGALTEAAGGRAVVVHCCARDVPFELIRRAGVSGIAVDYALLGKPELDAIGELVDGGVSVWLGIASATDTPISLDLLRGKVNSLWERLGFAAEEQADALVVTPACGMAGASPAYARRVMTVLRDVAESMREL